MAESTKVVTGEGRLSYAFLLEPRTGDDDGSKPKYSVSFLFPKSDKKTQKAILAAFEVAKEQGKTSKWGGKIPAKLDFSLRDGDEDKADDPAYAGMMFFNCSAPETKQPGIVKKTRMGLEKVTHSESPDGVYSGQIACVSVNLFPYEAKGKKGVGFGLNGVFIVGGGEPLGNVFNAEADFGSLLTSGDEDDDMS